MKQSREVTKKTRSNHEEEFVISFSFVRSSCVLRAFVALLLFCIPVIAQPIDRHALVSRHKVTMTSFDPLSPLSVGNGEFAFTVDPTGLQTFPELYSANNQTPLC